VFARLAHRFLGPEASAAIPALRRAAA
jgi:hypothetical protein